MAPRAAGGGCRTLSPLWRALPLATPRVHPLAAAITLTAAVAASVRSKPTASAPAPAPARAPAPAIRVACRGDTIGRAHAALRRGRALRRARAPPLMMPLARPPQVPIGPLHASVAEEVYRRSGGAVGRAQLLHEKHVGHLGQGQG